MCSWLTMWLGICIWWISWTSVEKAAEVLYFSLGTVLLVRMAKCSCYCCCALCWQLGVINMNSEVVEPEILMDQLRELKSVGVDGVMIDCWWGIVEAHNPQAYNWSGYKKLFQIVRDLNLKLQVSHILHSIFLLLFGCILEIFLVPSFPMSQKEFDTHNWHKWFIMWFNNSYELVIRNISLLLS